MLRAPGTWPAANSSGVRTSRMTMSLSWRSIRSTSLSDEIVATGVSANADIDTISKPNTKTRATAFIWAAPGDFFEVGALAHRTTHKGHQILPIDFEAQGGKGLA